MYITEAIMSYYTIIKQTICFIPQFFNEASSNIKYWNIFNEDSIWEMEKKDMGKKKDQSHQSVVDNKITEVHDVSV